MNNVGQPGVTSYATPTDLEIVAVRTVNAPRALVFDAYTNPKHLPNWMTGPAGWTMPVCEVDLRTGGATRYVYRNETGGEMMITGKFLEVTPPERIVATESWGEGWPESWNTVEFTEAGGRTTITTTMKYASKETRDAALESGMKEGMGASFARLDALLETLA
jgi:uncharacterized protein YndB with AHSA1/START domain